MISFLFLLVATFGARASEARYETMCRSLERVTGWSVAESPTEIQFNGAFEYAPPRYVPCSDPSVEARLFALHHEAVHGICWTRALRSPSLITAALSAAVHAPTTSPSWAALPDTHRVQIINNEVLACYRSARLAHQYERRGLAPPLLESKVYLQYARDFARASSETWALVTGDDEYPFTYFKAKLPGKYALAWVRIRIPHDRDVRAEFVLVLPERFAECADLLRSRAREVGRTWITYLQSRRWLSLNLR